MHRNVFNWIYILYEYTGYIYMKYIYITYIIGYIHFTCLLRFSEVRLKRFFFFNFRSFFFISKNYFSYGIKDSKHLSLI